MRRIILATTAAILSVALVQPSLPGGAATKKASFKKPVQVSADDAQSAAEPSIRSAPDGTLYIVAPQGLGSGVRFQDNGGGDVIWRSTDRGKTWEWLGSFDDALGAEMPTSLPTPTGSCGARDSRW